MVNRTQIKITSGRGIVDEFSNSRDVLDYSKNYFDVLPPQGFTVNNLVMFVSNIDMLFFDGNVNNDDVLYNFWRKGNGLAGSQDFPTGIGAPNRPGNNEVGVTGENDRVRCWLGNIEQRAAPRYNYYALWSKRLNNPNSNQLNEHNLFFGASDV
jgi:hypothetical protein